MHAVTKVTFIAGTLLVTKKNPLRSETKKVQNKVAGKLLHDLREEQEDMAAAIMSLQAMIKKAK